MRVLVYPHDMAIGGSQINAIELAHATSRLGHDVIVYGPPGPLGRRVEELGLELIEAPPVRRRPGRRLVEHLGRVLDERRIDVAHGYEWPPGLECYVACRFRPSTRAVTTVMSMAVAPFLPRTMPLVVGTAQIAARETAEGRDRVVVIEPPVDLATNGSVDPRDVETFRRDRDLTDGPLVVAVSRLARELKLEGLLTAIDAIAALDNDVRATLLVVGDGDARAEVDARADQVNRDLGRRAVVLTGELDDPRPAYAAADVCLAMGGSALRSMAFAKPLVVQGEGGFFRLLTPETLDGFLWTGWYGHGSDSGRPVDDLRGVLRDLLDDADRRRELGRFGRSVVEERFSLTAAARTQVALYESVLESPPPSAGRVPEDVVSVARLARHQLVRRGRRALGVRATDDFNARPVARSGPEPQDRSPSTG